MQSAQQPIPESVVTLLWSRVQHAKEHGVTSRIRQGLRYDLEELADCWPERADRRFVPHSIAVREPGARERWEHAVPLSVLFDRMVDCDTPGEMETVLGKYYYCRVITVEEDKRINALGLRSKMPEGQENDPLSRYVAAGIEF